VLGKALGGGVLPIAACIARSEALPGTDGTGLPPTLDVAGEYAYGHYTHEKNPVTARAALATLEVIEHERLVENAERVGSHALARMHEMKRRHPLVGDVRGRGFLLGLELVTDRDAKTPAADAAESVLYRALSRGLSFKTTMGNVLTLTPPLVTTREQMDRALDILDECLAEESKR